jgi:hypothetical protein
MSSNDVDRCVDISKPQYELKRLYKTVLFLMVFISNHNKKHNNKTITYKNTAYKIITNNIVTSKIAHRLLNMSGMLSKFRQLFSSKNLTAGELEQAIRRRPRVSPGSRLPDYPYYEPEYPGLNEALASRPKDNGMWLCHHCGHENALVHWHGAHPFGYLHCGRCKTVFSERDESTQVLGRGIMESADDTLVPGFDESAPVPYGIVCPNCGLSHRGRLLAKRSSGSYVTVSFRGIMCHCGRLYSWTHWYRFSIGPTHDWRGDQLRATKRAVTRRLEKRATL